jgi:hypothetical protein
LDTLAFRILFTSAIFTTGKNFAKSRKQVKKNPRENRKIPTS